MEQSDKQVELVSDAPQEGVLHGPWKPLGEHGLIALEKYEGDEYDFSDIALQSLHQLHCHFQSVEQALRLDLISKPDAESLWHSNQDAYDAILDRYLTR